MAGGVCVSEKRPFIITFIGDANIFGALLLILSLFPKFTERMGIYFEPVPNYLKVSFLSNDIMNLLIGMILLLISYGYLNLKRWGYWLMLSINLYYFAGWIIFYKQIPILVIIGLIFFLPTIKYFAKKDKLMLYDGKM